MKSFEHGDELPGGILTIKEGVLCPEETVLYLPIQEGVLALHGYAQIFRRNTLASGQVLTCSLPSYTAKA